MLYNCSKSQSLLVTPAGIAGVNLFLSLFPGFLARQQELKYATYSAQAAARFSRFLDNPRESRVKRRMKVRIEVVSFHMWCAYLQRIKLTEYHLLVGVYHFRRGVTARLVGVPAVFDDLAILDVGAQTLGQLLQRRQQARQWAL